MNLWKDKRLRLAVTRLGFEYLAAMLLMGLFALNSGNNLLYLVFSLMLGLFLASGWVSRRAIQDLELLRIEGGNLFARVESGVTLQLRDRAPGRTRCLEVRMDLEHAKVEPGFYPGGGRHGEERRVVLQARPERRGPVRVGRVEWCTAYPFGFLEKAWSWSPDVTLLVLPHPRAMAPRQDREGGWRPARARDGASSPSGARPFKERDPLSRMHWKRTAQRGTPWVRTFEEDPPSGLRLRLDLRAWAPGPAFEKELELLSGGILQARLQRRDISLLLHEAGTTRELHGWIPCWRALALAEAEGAFHGPGSALP